VVLFCGFVVCLCGVDFFFEISDEFVLAVIAYLDHPFLFLFLPTDSFVFRGWILSEVYPVVAVLSGCCGSQASFSIVQAVMINVVDEEMAGRVYYFTMHFYIDTLFADANGSDGIEGILAL
jgi:hypothetical protein